MDEINNEDDNKNRGGTHKLMKSIIKRQKWTKSLKSELKVIKKSDQNNR